MARLTKRKPRSLLLDYLFRKESDMSTIALLVGIDDYPGIANDLGECVNDVTKISDYLEDNGVTSIKMLLNTNATRSRIIEAVKQTLEMTSPGDVVLFTFSGHGTTIPTIDKNNEVDGLDEVLCPYDFGFDNPETFIRDKDLASFFAKNTPKGVAVYVILDSCYSGDMTRILATRPRAYPMPEDLHRVVQAARDWFAPVNRFVNGLVRYGPLAWIYSMFSRLFFGCRTNQPHGDDNLPIGLLAAASGGPAADGAFTPTLLDVLKEHPKADLITLVDITGRNMRRKGFSQVPQAEGALRNRFFLEPVE